MVGPGVCGAVQRRGSMWQWVTGVQVAPPPHPNTGLSKHGDPAFPHFLVFFWTHHFCVPMQ